MAKVTKNGGLIVSHERALLHEVRPHIYQSTYDIENFYFTDRLDEFAVVEPGEAALFVDVGDPELIGTHALDVVIDTLQVPWQNTSAFITHPHDDHDGNILYCIDNGMEKVYCGKYVPFEDARVQAFLQATGALREGDLALTEAAEFLLSKGRFPQKLLDHLIPLEEGATLEMAGYTFEVLYTPGHTLEHASLLEREKKMLFAGDHLLSSSPGLMQFDPDAHLVWDFLKSMEYLRSLDLEIVFMAHTDSLVGTETINEFISGIIAAYSAPLEKTYDIVAQSDAPLTVYDVARTFYSYLKGGIEGQGDNLRVRRVAIPFGYLEYLVDAGRLQREIAADGCYLYRV